MSFAVQTPSTVIASRSSFKLASSSLSSSRGGRKSTLRCNASSIIVRESDIDKKYPVSGSVYKITMSMRPSHISLGLLLKPGPDGRPEVKTIRPGGKAKGKIEVGDVVLATSCVGLQGVDDTSWGHGEKGFVDTIDCNFDQANAAMTTNSHEITLIMDRAYDPVGNNASFTSSNPADVKEWAAKKAAEARAKRGGSR